jgi:phosphatidylserine decarboxylase
MINDSFNEFFYRKLKPDARPCTAPDNSFIAVSPADCRSVVFNKIEKAQEIWVKGRDFTMQRLLGSAYPDEAAKFEGGALGIFRLAPQDYHRFHVPVDGVMGEPKAIEGQYYTVNPMAIRSSYAVLMAVLMLDWTFTVRMYALLCLSIQSNSEKSW